MDREHVILVDRNDNPQGVMEKMEAHRKGLLHRAFSVFVFNDNGDFLIHQRAAHKYHSGGLWTNACCSHPRENETPEEGAHRRLKEEMGFDCPIEKAFEFTYKAQLDNELTEHEYDHVFIGTYNGIPRLNREEVQAYKFISARELLADMENEPSKYTEWFKLAVQKVIDFKTSQKKAG